MSDECMTPCADSHVKVEEFGKTAVFPNPGRRKHRIYRVDDCIIKRGMRCDYLVNGEGSSVLVELKGCDIKHAVNQVFATLEHPDVKPLLHKKIGILIVPTRCAPAYNNYVRKAKERAAKDYFAGLHVVNMHSRMTMDQVCSIKGK